MQFVDHDELAFREMARVTFLRQHDRQTFRCCDENMRAAFAELHALAARRIARSQSDPYVFLEPHSHDWRPDILSNVIRECAQRRNVNASHGRVEWAAIELPEERVKNSEKRGQRFAASGWRSQQDRFTIEDRRHGQELRVRERWVRFREPAGQALMQSLLKRLRSSHLLSAHAVTSAD